MGTKVLQINANRSWRAQDMLSQYMVEMRVGLCAVSEPAHVLDTWAGSRNGLAAVCHNHDFLPHSCVLFRSGLNFVAVKCGALIIASCYISPNVNIGLFRGLLDELDELIGEIRGQAFVLCGDFNSHSVQWGCPSTDDRGALLQSWAAGRDLRLVNSGRIPTCVRPQGDSIVDLTWVSSGLVRSVRNWCVRDDMESLSDHLYISFVVGGARAGSHGGFASPYPRWNLAKLDRELFVESLEWACGVGPSERELETPEGLGEWLDRVMRVACDASAPRVGSRGPRENAYWWNDTIAELRRISMRARRLWSRCKKSGSLDVVAAKQAAYRLAKENLGLAIKKAKTEAWNELLASIDEDPWGLPYRLVLKRLMKSGPSLTERLDPPVLRALLDSLFPAGVALPHIDWEERWGWTWSDEHAVTPLEVSAAIREKRNINTAPGPNGVRAAVWRLVPDAMVLKVADLFTRLLRDGVFPADWKVARLVLLAKGGTPRGALPKVRPICLLDEVGKVFERIIASRLRTYMEQDPLVDLAPNQFGFRRGRSTTDALMLVKSLARETIRAGKVGIAISLDVANAFNSLPWRIIRRMLRWRKRFPIYLCRIVDAYLSNRWVEFMDANGRLVRRGVTAGVPQGSVLGPLLWNIAFDDVLRLGLYPGCSTVCYADDTLIFVTAEGAEDACALANRQIHRVVERIRGLGLGIAEAKTVAVMFSGRGVIGAPSIRVGRSTIRISNRMRYLGVMIDSRLSFGPHFEYVEAKATRAMAALGRLMPNLRGPMESRRKLFANALLSIVLYAAPIWADELETSRSGRLLFRRLLRMIAHRVVCAYNTVAYDATCLLARIPPILLLTAGRERTFFRTAELKVNGQWTLAAVTAIRAEESIRLRADWMEHLRDEFMPGVRTREAINPNFDLWMDRIHGGLSYRMTQMLTGHGCFASFLHRIRKADTDQCFHCNNGVDTPEHTLQVCTTWVDERGDLIAVIGGDLSLPNVVGKIVRSGEAWTAFSLFCERVLGTKEEEERRRQAAGDAASLHPLFDGESEDD